MHVLFYVIMKIFSNRYSLGSLQKYIKYVINTALQLPTDVLCASGLYMIFHKYILNSKILNDVKNRRKCAYSVYFS